MKTRRDKHRYLKDIEPILRPLLSPNERVVAFAYAEVGPHPAWLLVAMHELMFNPYYVCLTSERLLMARSSYWHPQRARETHAAPLEEIRIADVKRFSSWTTLRIVLQGRVTFRATFSAMWGEEVQSIRAAVGA